MGYLGASPSSGFISNVAKEDFTGLTTNYVDITNSISSLNDVIVLVNSVVQLTSTLTFTSSTRITLGDTLTASDKVTVIFLGKVTSNQAPGTGQVTNDMLAGSIANSKLSNSSITLNGSAVSLGGSATVGGDNTPCFSAKLGSDLSMASASTVYDVVFGTEYFDVGSCYDNSTGIFTVPSGEAGKYKISTSCMFIDGAGNVSDMLIYLHSTISSSASQDLVARANSTSDGTLFTHKELAFNTILSLGVGDQIKIQVYQQTNNSTSITLKSGTGTVFSAFKIIE